MFKIFSAIRKALKKPITVIFIDTGYIDEIDKGQYKESFEIEDKQYVINPELIINDTLFYHSQYAEPLQLEANNNKWKYYIDSKRFKSVYDNKVLDQMMYVQEKGLLNYILLGVIIVAGLLAVNMYLDYMMFTNMESIINQLDKVETVNIGGK
jgi:hypothetical protein